MRLPILVFDCETVPDLATGQRLHGLGDLPPEQAAQALAQLRQQDLGMDFPRLPFHEVVCLSGVWVDEHSGIRLFSFSQEQDSEAQILEKFFRIFQKHTPTLVSWNGSGFDVPVLTYRALKHGLSAPRFYDQGELDRARRFDNYLSRYHSRHTDLMDVLSLYQGGRSQKMDDVAQLLGLPGKAGQSGHQVSQMVRDGQWAALRQYCESDVLNTWLIFLRWQLLRGGLTAEAHQQWVAQTQDHLQGHPTQQEFLRRWLSLAEENTP